jgi:micrococcal nuclease
MKVQSLFTFIILVNIAVAVSQNAAPSAENLPQTYGTATVTRVLAIDSACTLLCDIDEFPSIIGQNIPVYLEGIQLLSSESVDEKVVSFLREILIPASPQTPPSIILKNIRRGTTFSLIADIEVNGIDLAQMLVDKGLARRILHLSTTAASGQSSAASPSAPPKSPLSSVPCSAAFVASKTSKVYHRSTCPHAARLDQTKAVTFKTRAEAETNGRRPCKTCNP